MTRSFFSNSVSLLLQQGCNFLLPLIAMPIAVSRYGVDQFGVLVYFQSLMQFALVGIDYGFNITGASFASAHRDKPLLLLEKILSVLLAKTLMLLVVVVILVAISFTLDANERSLLLVTFLAVLGQFLYAHWYFLGVEQLAMVTMVTVFSRVLSVFYLLFFMDDANSLVSFALVLSLPYLFVGVVSLFIILVSFKRYFSLVTFSPWFAVKELKEGFPIFLSSVSGVVYASSSVIVLNAFSGAYYAGVFAIADRLVKAFLGVVGSISSGYFPVSARLAVELNLAAFLRVVAKFLGFMILIAAVSPIALISFGGDLIFLFVGDEVELSEYVTVLSVLAFVPLIVVFSNVLGTHIMTNIGMRREFGVVMSVSTFLYLFMLLLLVPYWAHVGAAFAVLSIEVIVSTSMALLVFRKYRIKVN